MKGTSPSAYLPSGSRTHVPKSTGLGTGYSRLGTGWVLCVAQGPLPAILSPAHPRTPWARISGSIWSMEVTRGWWLALGCLRPAGVCFWAPGHLQGASVVCPHPWNSLANCTGALAAGGGGLGATPARLTLSRGLRAVVFLD